MDLILLVLIISSVAIILDHKTPSRAYTNRGIFKGTVVFVLYEAPKTIVKAITAKMKGKKATSDDALTQSEESSTTLLYPVKLQQLEDGEWMALTIGMPGCVASATDPNEAIEKVRVIQQDALKLGLAEPEQEETPNHNERLYPCGWTEPALYFDASELVLASDTDKQTIFACETCVSEEGLTVVGPSLAKVLGSQEAAIAMKKVIAS